MRVLVKVSFDIFLGSGSIVFKVIVGLLFINMFM